MTALYAPVVVASFQILGAGAAIACGVLALREHRHHRYVPATSTVPVAGRSPLSPWSVYSMGFLVVCLLAQLARHAQRPSTVLTTVAAHASVVALLMLVWGICNTYARLFSLCRSEVSSPGHGSPSR